MSHRSGKNPRVVHAYHRAVGKTPLFSAEECNRVIRWVAAKPFVARNETRTYANWPEPGIRGHKEFPISLATREPAIVAFRKKLERIIGDLNREVWRFDIMGLTTLTILRYDVGDQISLHTDLQSDACDLKLGIILQLSPSDAYEGGMYEYGVSPPAPLSREQGTLLVLPAWVPHKVTPITAGTRYTAVCFAFGPSFR